MNSAEAVAAARKVPYDPKNKKAYHEAIGKIETSFRYWLGREYAFDMNGEQQQVIWSQAWADGHASGYGDVENHYIELADFARDIIAAR